MEYNPITQVKMIPNFKRGHVVHWTIDPAFKDPEPHAFFLQASQVPTFSELIFEIPAGNSFFAIDNTGVKQTHGDDFYYRVKLVTPTATYYSYSLLFGVTAEEKYKYLKAAEIVRKELLRMRKFAGTDKAWLLKRKTYGTSVRSDIDPVTGQPIADNSTSDYGVGIDGGYFSPMAIMYSIESTQESRELSREGLGVNETYGETIRMIGFPAVDNHDIICNDATKVRYSVSQRDNIYYPGTDIAVVQKINMRRIATSDSVYKIELPSERNELFI